MAPRAAKKATDAGPAKAATKPSGAKAAPARAKAEASPSPAKPAKVIEKAGDGYRSPDGRFSVEGTPGTWYVADTRNPSPLGTPTIVGPFRTLAEVKAAVEAARSA
jgi:hypothetical protein